MTPAVSLAPNVVKLRRPIVTGSGVVLRDLAFAPITADTMIRLEGIPFIEGPEGGQAAIDFQKAARYVAHLTGIDEPAVRSMSALDFGVCISMIGRLLRQTA